MFFTDTLVVRILVFISTAELGRGCGNMTHLNTKNFTVLTDTRSFFLNKCSSYCCKFLVNFQNSEKVDLESSARVFIAFTEEWFPEVLCHHLKKCFCYHWFLQSNSSSFIAPVVWDKRVCPWEIHDRNPRSVERYGIESRHPVIQDCLIHEKATTLHVFAHLCFVHLLLVSNISLLLRIVILSLLN